MTAAVDPVDVPCGFSPELSECRYCPKCGVDWQGWEIPAEDRHYYGGKTHGSNLMGIEIPGKFDGISEWACQSCGQRWDRFTGEPIAEAAP